MLAPTEFPPRIKLGKKDLWRRSEVIHCRDLWFARASGSAIHPYTPAQDEILIGVGEVAKLLGLSRPTVRKYMAMREALAGA